MNDKPNIFITFFGEFSLTVDGKTVTSSVNRSRKMWTLLQYLIVNNGSTISQGDLIDVLWPEEGSGNPVNALKTLLCRLRATLKEEGLPYSKEIIVQGSGSYRWNPEFSFEADIKKMENFYRDAQKRSVDDSARLPLYRNAISVYKGDFLPEAKNEMWAIPVQTYYHSLYVKIVKDALRIYLEQEQYDEAAAVCQEAFLKEQFEEEIHSAYIQALMRSGKTQTAIEHYEYISELFYNQLGVKLSNPITELYKEMLKTSQKLETNLDIIKEELREKNTSGVFVCEYQVFKKIYWLQERSMARMGQTVCLCLINVTDFDSNVPEHKLLDKAMTGLSDAIHQCLREGDIVSRFSVSQMLIMLPSATYENGIMVSERIVKSFKKNNPRIKVALSYKLKPMQPRGFQSVR